jgi:hypothetical protein
MKATNNLTSHMGESRSFRADKMMPKETLKNYRAGGIRSGCSKWLKRFYKKKNRNFNNNIDNFRD